LKLEYHNGFQSSGEAEATRLVIRDSFGQPIIVVLELAPGTITLYKAKKGDNGLFDSILSKLGIKSDVDVQEINI
jgi:hypothetical protein